jgi:hypothetical protein
LPQLFSRRDVDAGNGSGVDDQSPYGFVFLRDEPLDALDIESYVRENDRAMSRDVLVDRGDSAADTCAISRGSVVYSETAMSIL